MGLHFEEGDCPAPVGDLSPWIDVVAGGAFAAAKVSVVMDEDDESFSGEGACEVVQTVFFDGSEAVGHGDGGFFASAFGPVQPASEDDAVLSFECDVKTFGHGLRLTGELQTFIALRFLAGNYIAAPGGVSVEPPLNDLAVGDLEEEEVFVAHPDAAF